jgi:hypothetical protein
LRAVASPVIGLLLHAKCLGHARHYVFLVREKLLQAGYFHSVGAFFAGFDIELNPVAFLNFVDEAGLVNKDFFLGIVGDDEAEAFGVVEEFNGAGKHVRG